MSYFLFCLNHVCVRIGSLLIFLTRLYSLTYGLSWNIVTNIFDFPCSPQREGSESPDLGLEEGPYQQPMTPRRVKRQSRHRASGRSQTRSTQGRGSQRSRRHQYLNPVNRLMDKANESSTSTDSYHPAPGSRPPTGGRQGHSNPMYVHSRPNSTYSMNSSPPGQDPMERPPSVHSSYSNYHGQRPSINPNPYGRPPVQTLTAGMIGGSNHHRSNRSMMQPNGHVNPTGTLGSIRSSVYSSTGTMRSEREKPPPYMFGVNSETVIWLDRTGQQWSRPSHCLLSSVAHGSFRSPCAFWYFLL